MVHHCKMWAFRRYNPQDPNSKFVATGNIFVEGTNGKRTTYTQDFIVPKKERVYLAYIFTTMLSAFGGDFDDDDTIYVDIYSVDNIRKDNSNGFGGAWDRHFGPYGDVRNMAMSSWVGWINDKITFRLSVQGDDFVGATYVIMEL